MTKRRLNRRKERKWTYVSILTDGADKVKILNETEHI
jgi:hypothetical protein